MIRGTFCDLAIKIQQKIQYLIEVKAIGISLKENHLKQAINYGANNGIQWVILTNGLEWKLYSIRFEKPINYDLVCSFNFLELSPKVEKDQDVLFMLSREGLLKKARDSFYEKVKCVNRFTLAYLILSNPVLNLLRKELRKLSDGVKVETAEIEKIIRKEILKRELLESEEAKETEIKIGRKYKKKNKASKAETVSSIQKEQNENRMSTENIIAENNK